MVESNIRNIMFLPGKRNFEKANAAIDDDMVQKESTEIEIILLFLIPVSKLEAVQTLL